MKQTTYSDQYLFKFIKEKVIIQFCVCVCIKWLNTLANKWLKSSGLKDRGKDR